jgi:hypothetical protein
MQARDIRSGEIPAQVLKWVDRLIVKIFWPAALRAMRPIGEER